MEGTTVGVRAHERRRALACAAGFSLLYAVTMYAGRQTRIPPSELALAWPAAAVSLVWLLAVRSMRERVFAVAMITIISGVLNQLTSVEPVAAWLFGLVNASNGLMGAVILRRIGWEGPRPVRSAREAAELGFASLAGGAVSAVAGGLVAQSRLGTDLWDGVGLIGFRNVLSAFVVSAALMAAPGVRRRLRRDGGTVLAGVGAALAATVILMHVGWPMAFALIPPLLWVALRCGTEVTSAVVAVQGVIVVRTTVRGIGPFSSSSSLEERVLLAQALILVLAVVGLVVSVTQHQREIALTESRRDRDRLRRLMDAALVAAAHVDVTSNGEVRVAEVNAALVSLTGRSRESLLGSDPTTWLSREDAQRFQEGVAAIHSAGVDGWRGQLQMAPSHGGGWVDAGLAFVGDRRAAESAEEDQAGWLKLQMVDITAQKQAEQELAHMALHDDLTGLANRTLWTGRLELAVAQASHRRNAVAVFYVDIDHFKQINDTYGHALGDEVLKEVARRLSGVVRPADTVARIGGDEFVVLCPSLAEPDEVDLLAQRLLDAFAVPFEAGPHLIAMSVSVGVALAEQGDARTLMRHADAALYTAKDKGRGRFEVFNPEHHATRDETARLLVDMERAHREGEFVLEYQPIVDAHDGQVVAVEALLRWNHPERGRLLPAEFLEVLETSDLIHGVGQWILRQACKDAAAFAAPGIPMTVHVNISARELSRPGLVERVREALGDHGLPPECLVLEITETRLFTVSGSLLADLGTLRAMGVRLAVDDFGTGFGTLTHLVDLPVSIAKLDRSFVVDIVNRPNARSVSSAVRAMADGLGMDAIAEGVESAEQAAVLRDLGYRYLQGFLYGRSIPASEVHVRLQQAS